MKNSRSVLAEALRSTRTKRLSESQLRVIVRRAINEMEDPALSAWGGAGEYPTEQPVEDQSGKVTCVECGAQFVPAYEMEDVCDEWCSHEEGSMGAMKITRGQIRRLVRETILRESHDSRDFEIINGVETISFGKMPDGRVSIRIDAGGPEGMTNATSFIPPDRIHEFAEWLEHVVLGQAPDADDNWNPNSQANIDSYFEDHPDYHGGYDGDKF